MDVQKKYKIEIKNRNTKQKYKTEIQNTKNTIFVVATIIWLINVHVPTI